MGGHIFAVSLLCILVFGQRAAGDAAFEVSPTNIIPGITTSLAFNCSFVFGGIPDWYNFHFLMAVTISKSPDNRVQTYQDVAKVSAGDKQHVEVLLDLNATSVSGLMQSNGETYVAMQWDNPTEALVGFYRCSADGLADDLSSRLVYKTVEVTSGGVVG